MDLSKEPLTAYEAWIAENPKRREFTHEGLAIFRAGAAWARSQEPASGLPEPAPKIPEPSDRLRRLSAGGSQGPWFTVSMTGHLVGGMPGGLNPEDEEAPCDEDDEPIESEEDPDRDLYAEASLCVMLQDAGPCMDDDADLAAEAVNYARAVLEALEPIKEA